MKMLGLNEVPVLYVNSSQWGMLTFPGFALLHPHTRISQSLISDQLWALGFLSWN